MIKILFVCHIDKVTKPGDKITFTSLCSRKYMDCRSRWSKLLEIVPNDSKGME